MKNIFFMLIILGLVGCATNKNKKNQDELSGITNDSFKLPPAKLYQIVDDFIGEEISEEPNVLKQESLAKVPQDEVESPEDVKGDINKILVACYHKKFKQGFAMIDTLYKEYRKNPIYWTQVGSCYLLQGSKRKALLYYNKAREVKKNYAPPINNIGVIFQKYDLDQKALKAYEEAKRLSSFSLTPLFNLAQIYIDYGFIEEGKVLFESMYRVNSKDQDVLYGLGFIYFVEGNYGKAVSFYNNLNEKYYKTAGIGANVAYAFALNGNKSDASAVLKSLDMPRSSQEAKYVQNIKSYVEKK